MWVGYSDADVQVMVRPRPGSFVYTPAEVEVMLLDIQAAREAGAVGVVFGCLTVEGEVDTAVTTQLCKAAEGMEGELDTVLKRL